jgi:hypothetical protein
MSRLAIELFLDCQEVQTSLCMHDLTIDQSLLVDQDTFRPTFPWGGTLPEMRHPSDGCPDQGNRILFIIP